MKPQTELEWLFKVNEVNNYRNNGEGLKASCKVADIAEKDYRQYDDYFKKCFAEYDGEDEWNIDGEYYEPYFKKAVRQQEIIQARAINQKQAINWEAHRGNTSTNGHSTAGLIRHLYDMPDGYTYSIAEFYKIDTTTKTYNKIYVDDAENYYTSLQEAALAIRDGTFVYKERYASNNTWNTEIIGENSSGEPIVKVRGAATEDSSSITNQVDLLNDDLYNAEVYTQEGIRAGKPMLAPITTNKVSWDSINF